jgi:hypothetical protein
LSWDARFPTYAANPHDPVTVARLSLVAHAVDSAPPLACPPSLPDLLRAARRRTLLSPRSLLSRCCDAREEERLVLSLLSAAGPPRPQDRLRGHLLEQRGLLSQLLRCAADASALLQTPATACVKEEPLPPGNPCATLHRCLQEVRALAAPQSEHRVLLALARDSLQVIEALARAQGRWDTEASREFSAEPVLLLKQAQVDIRRILLS